MKFRFCGDSDCPDWLLMQINTMSSLKIEQFQAMCEQVALSLEGGDLDYGRLKGLGKEANLDSSDLKACTSGIAFILRSGTCYGVLSRELGAELEQLGLESRLASVVTAIYSDHYDNLRASAKASMLRRSTVTDVKCVVVSDDQQSSDKSDAIKMSMKIGGHDERSVSVNMTRGQASMLLEDLLQVNDRIKSLCGE